MRKLLILSFFLPLLAWAQSSLPPCPEKGVKSDCLGYVTQSDRSQYVGEFKNGKRNGLGIQYRSEGTVAFAGIWQEDHLSMSLALNQRDFPFKKIGITPPLPLPALVSKNLTSGFEMKIRANSDIFPIKAGKVVYVSPKGTHPATMLIDHGAGLYSSYTSFFEPFGQFSKSIGEDVSESDPLAERIQSNQETLVLQILRADNRLGQNAFSGELSFENFNSFYMNARRLDFDDMAFAFNAAFVELEAPDSDTSIQISHLGTLHLERDLRKGDQPSFLFPIHATPYRLDGRVKGFFSSRPIPSAHLQVDDLKSSFRIVAS